MKSGRLKCKAENIIELIIAAIHQLKKLFIFTNINFLHINSSNIGENNTAYIYIIGVLVIVSGGVEIIKSDDRTVRILKPIKDMQNE
ncbi:hypothetical protein BSK50_14115 [Paenibacillus odorifer]|nr:hypothetical protein BSK50_14115 [Paenibacillus odorifer]